MKEHAKTVSSLLLITGLILFSSGLRAGPAASSGTNNPFGVLEFFAWDHDWNHHHYTKEKVIKAADLMKEAGIGWVRMDFLWADIEPRSNQFVFDRYDEIVRILSEKDIRILGLLEYNPSWRAVAWNTAPEQESYIRYALRTAEHFKGKVKYWEIWNEPDEKTYWEPQDNMKAYSRLLKSVSSNLRRVDPECKIVLGGLSSTIVLSLRRVYKNIGSEYFDVVNIHPFVDPLLPNRLQILQGIYAGVYRSMKEYKDQEKEIWFTEIGCPGVKTPDKTNGWWNGMSPTEEQQAEWVNEVYTNCLQWKGVKRIFWAFFRDVPGHWNNGVDYFGLVSNDFSGKPAFLMYKKIGSRGKK
ncbi:MAG: beta-galactosidase [bacterium]|nr:beta-galactosidase [bacterium]